MSVGSHYVPRLILRRFSPAPSDENPIIWRLDKETGHISRTRINSQTVINDYNRLSDDFSASIGVAPQHVEHDIFGSIEDTAGKLISMLDEGIVLNDDERVSLAVFLCLQHTRTPRMRTTTMFWQEELEPLLAMAGLHDREAVRKALTASGRLASSEEVESFIETTYRELEEKSIIFTPSQDREVWAMFLSIDKLARKVAREMTWILQRSTRELPFGISDHPVAIYDPHVRGASVGGWFRSTGTEVSMPIGPELCLMLVPGDARQIDGGPVGGPTVDEMNLKSYGSSEWAMYAHEDGMLERVRMRADEHPDKIQMYTPPPAEITGPEPDGRPIRAPKPSRRPRKRR
jgi:Protein of unknown function (DUF4238)